MKIVFLDGYTLNPGDMTWEAFEALGDFIVYDRTAPQDVLSRAAGAEVLIVNKTRLGEEHFAGLPALRLVTLASAGYDTVDVAAARRHGIVVSNAAGYGNAAVAQMVVAHLLNVTNQVGQYAQMNRDGFWAKSPDYCCWDSKLVELTGKQVCIVGFGQIGSTVARCLRPFGVRLCAVTSKTQAQLPADVRPVSIEEGFATSDVVSLNCPLTSDNERFVNAQLLNRAKQGLILINTARGRLVDEAAVVAALQSGRLGAYCADVLSVEPPQANNPLFAAPNCFITPHIAWATEEARQRIAHILINNIRSFYAGKPQNVVN